MTGTWPNLDVSDLESRVRTYINEVAPGFFTQAEIYRWLSLTAKDVAQKTLCVRRVLDAVTVNATREVPTNAYKVIAVEYIPAVGYPIMLRKIDPLKLGNQNLNGAPPESWYEFGSNIGIEPIPNAIYRLRLYVADLPKILRAAITAWNSGWTGSGTGTWTNGASTAAYVGTTGQAGIDTYGTNLTALANHTFNLVLSGVSNCGLVLSAGTTNSPTLNTNGFHSVTLVAAGNTTFKMTATMTGATGGLTVDDLDILEEADFAAAAEQTELPSAWQHLLIIGATARALAKDRRAAPATMLETIYNNELAYLRQNIVEIIPDGRNSLHYQ